MIVLHNSVIVKYYFQEKTQVYKCKDCEKEFKIPKKISERQGLKSEPYEEMRVCPFCESHLIFKVEPRYCHYCGARVRGEKDYCCAECERKGIRAYRAQERRREEMAKHPLMQAVREVDTYNKRTGKRLSYGEYFAGRR
jgi:DNA-directed RNA polymerase subunit RPC12/RpoP